MKKQILFYNIVISILCFFISQKVVAQQFTYSQFWANKAALNPAFAVSEGGLRLYTHMRMQSPSTANAFLYNKYSTAFTLNQSIGQKEKLLVGGGLNLSSSVEGEGLYKSHNIGLILGTGYKFEVNQNDAIIAIACNLGYNRNNLEFDKLVFSDQIYDVKPDINPITNATFPEEWHYGFGSANFAGLLIFPLLHTTRNGNETKNTISLVSGINYYVINKDNSNFIENRTATEPHTTFHLGLEWKHTGIKNGDDYGYSFYPNVKLEMQNGLASLNTGLMWTSLKFKAAGGKEKETYNPFFVGLYYQRSMLGLPSMYKNADSRPRHTNSLIAIIGFGFKKKERIHKIGISGDFGILTGLTTNKTAGSYELTYSLHFFGKTKTPKYEDDKSIIKQFFKKSRSNHGCPTNF